MRNPPVVLVIGGFDPSSGAGVTADIKTLAAHGCYGLACITAATVQNTKRITRIQPLSPGLISKTLRELMADFKPDAVKIGMLGSAGAARAVLKFLQRYRPAHAVLDPVLRSSGGTSLLDPGGLASLRRLLPMAEVITPNAAEAAALLGTLPKPGSIRLRRSPRADLRRMALLLQKMGAKDVVITGGDLRPREARTTDLLLTSEGEFRSFSSSRIASRATHGTGCAFASTVAAHLARGYDVEDAVAWAKQYVAGAIRSAPRLGHGYGPLNHFWNTIRQPRTRSK